jgi:hypothetical protein
MQGDQIGRIFGFWAIVFFGRFFEKYILSPTFFPRKKLRIDFRKNGLGYIHFGEFLSETPLATLPGLPDGIF